jgi:thiamine biosynthesis lipoprotein ApbE
VSAVTASRSVSALGTKAVIVVGDPDVLEAAHEVLTRELDAIDLACSRFRSDSELARMNASSGDEVHVSPLLLEALRTALDAAEATAGLVDPTIGRTLRLAGYDASFSVIRGRDGSLVRPSFVRDPDWRTVELDEARHTVRVPKGVELDLGATAKALAADRAARQAHAATGTAVLVSLGGDIAVAGEPPAGGWSVRVAEDNAAPLDAPGPTVGISSGGLATSGTTVRRWASAHGPLHHIVDPRTGRPANAHWRTVTVAAASCVDANTASTAAIVLGQHAPRWLLERGLPARLVRYDWVTSCVAGWPAETA